VALFLNDICLLTVKGRCYGQRIILTQPYRVSTVGAPGENANVQLGYLAAGWNSVDPTSPFVHYMGCLSGDYQSLSIKTQVIHPVRLAYREDVQVSLGMGGAGTVANDSAAVTLRTDLAGRKEIATKHVGPIPDDFSINGVLTEVAKTRLVAFGSAIRQTITSATSVIKFTPIIFHRADKTWTDITGYVIGEQGRVQRRRTVGLGE